MQKLKSSEIIEIACEVCGVSESDIFSPSNHRGIADAKAVATVCLYDLCDNASFPSVSIWMGNKHKSHSSMVTRYYRARKNPQKRVLIAEAKRRIRAAMLARQQTVITLTNSNESATAGKDGE